MKSLLDGFIKCNVEKVIRKGECFVSITKDKNAVSFSKELSEKANLKVGDRLDLYKNGKTFAFVKSDVGLCKIHTSNNQCRILNKSAVLEIVIEAGDERKFDAWVDAGIIFFRVEK